jgi:hypothetical protein
LNRSRADVCPAACRALRVTSRVTSSCSEADALPGGGDWNTSASSSSSGANDKIAWISLGENCEVSSSEGCDESRTSSTSNDGSASASATLTRDSTPLGALTSSPVVFAALGLGCAESGRCRKASKDIWRDISVVEGTFDHPSRAPTRGSLRT